VTLREALGADVRRVHELVDHLLDSDDSLIVLLDGHRAISYGAGFGLSPCQLELMAVDIERAVRATGGSAQIRRNERLRRQVLPDGDHDRDLDEAAWTCAAP
jgi:hypothetical protein